MVTAAMRYALERQCLNQKKDTLGIRHPDTLAYMAQLAADWFGQGRFREVEPLAVQIVELRKEILGARHPVTLSSMADMEDLFILSKGDT